MNRKIIISMLLYFLVNVSLVFASNPVRDLQITQFPSSIIGGSSYNLSYSFNSVKDVNLFLSFYFKRGINFDGNEVNISHAYLDGEHFYCSSIYELSSYTFACPPDGREFLVSKGIHNIVAILDSNPLIEPEDMNISVGLFTENYEEYLEPEEVSVVSTQRRSLPFKCYPGDCIDGKKITWCVNPYNNLTKQYNVSCISELSLSPVSETVNPVQSGSVGVKQENTTPEEDLLKKINDTKASLDEDVNSFRNMWWYVIYVSIGIAILAVIIYFHQMYKLKRQADIENEGNGIIEEIEKRKRNRLCVGSDSCVISSGSV